MGNILTWWSHLAIAKHTLHMCSFNQLNKLRCYSLLVESLCFLLDEGMDSVRFKLLVGFFELVDLCRNFFSLINFLLLFGESLGSSCFGGEVLMPLSAL